VFKRVVKGCLALLLVLVLLLGLWVFLLEVLPRWQLRSKVRVGWTRSQVVRSLGKPDRVARSIGDLTIDWDSHYEPVPTTPIEKEVLEYYVGGQFKVYVYMNAKNRVTSVFIAET
jgi:hypothetical protein